MSQPVVTLFTWQRVAIFALLIAGLLFPDLARNSVRTAILTAQSLLQKATLHSPARPSAKPQRAEVTPIVDSEKFVVLLKVSLSLEEACEIRDRLQAHRVRVQVMSSSQGYLACVSPVEGGMQSAENLLATLRQTFGMQAAPWMIFALPSGTKAVACS